MSSLSSTNTELMAENRLVNLGAEHSWHSLPRGCQLSLSQISPSPFLSLSPLHSSKGEHSSWSSSDRGLVFNKRPLQQERALLEVPVALQPAETETATQAKWASQACEGCDEGSVVGPRLRRFVRLWPRCQRRRTQKPAGRTKWQVQLAVTASSTTTR